MGGDVLAGGVYAVQREDGWFGIVKVLAVHPGVVHLRQYRNTYRERPAAVDTSQLTLSFTMDDLRAKPPGWALPIGHMPVETDGFLREQPILLAVVPVTDDELEALR